MSIEDFELTRLSPGHNILPFDCNDEDLNDFLFNKAKLDQADLQNVTYLLESDTQTVAFFTILNDKITVEDFDSKTKWKSLTRHNKRKKSYPAVKLGRLGINKDHQRIGLGRDILNYLKIWFVENNKTGCKFITVDAYSESLSFYSKNGFMFMTEKDKASDTRAMFYDLTQIFNAEE